MRTGVNQANVIWVSEQNVNIRIQQLNLFATLLFVEFYGRTDFVETIL